MPKLIESPTRIITPDGDNKIIEEFVGNVNTTSSDISIAKMKASTGWSEPGQNSIYSKTIINFLYQFQVLIILR